MRVSAVIRWLLVASFLCGLLFWTLLAIPQQFVRSDKLVGVCFIIAAYSLPALICALTLDRGRYRGLMWSGIIASAASVPAWLALMLLVNSLPRIAEYVLYKTAGSTSIWAVFCVVLSALLHQRMPNAVAAISCALTITLASIMGFAGVIAIWTEGELWRTETGMGRFFGVLGVFVVLGTILTMILARLRQITKGDASEIVIRLPFTAWCPRCGQEQSLQTGGDACGHCGLSIRVVVP